ncbi:MAG: hypothetical protein KDA78_04350 [Planctomycetaceae bacterium]|nr:hypothetical protein [Planctomycetaceae bacterium]
MLNFVTNGVQFFNQLFSGRGPVIDAFNGFFEAIGRRLDSLMSVQAAAVTGGRVRIAADGPDWSSRRSVFTHKRV